MKLILQAILNMCIIVTFALTSCKEDDQGTPPESFGVDHLCSVLADIPAQWIDSVKTLSVHYAHTSHGEQITVGLERIESANATYNAEVASSSLPVVTGAMCIFDGQETETYITPELYWQSQDGMNLTRDVLNHNPSIKVSMWMWCTQLDYFTQEEVQAYLDSMTVLEGEFPDVVFVYATGNAQATGDEGYNRYLRNNQIRQYCEDNDKILFDFADLDCWWFNTGTNEWEYETYDHSGISVPTEHPEFHGDEAAHTTYDSCDQKGRAFWWLMARIAGWSGTQ